MTQLEAFIPKLAEPLPEPQKLSPIFLAFQAQVSCIHHGQNTQYYAQLLDAESMATGDLPDAVEDEQDSQKLQLKGAQDEDALLCMDDAFAESVPRQASAPEPPLPLPRHRPASKMKDTIMTSSEASSDEDVVDAHDPPSPASHGHSEAAGVFDWLLEDDDEIAKAAKGPDPTVPATPEEPLSPAALQRPLSSLLGLQPTAARSPGDHLSDYSPSLPPDEDHDEDNGLTEELLQQLGSENFAIPGDSAQSEPPTAMSTAVEAHTDTGDASAIPAEVASLPDARDASAIPGAPDVPTDPGVAPPPPPIPEAEPGASGVPRAPKQHPDSFAWGSFRFTFSDASKRPPHGQWQAKCRFHMLNQKTLCTRAMNVGPDLASKDLALRLLKGWCLAAPQHQRKSTHAATPLQQKDALPHEVLDARQRDMPPVPANVLSDAELDAIAAAAETRAASRASAKRKRAVAESSPARPKAKSAAKVAAKREAKSKAKVKAKAKAKGRSVASKAEAKAKASAASVSAPADEAGSDPPTSSGSSSSSSNSGSSSSLSTDSTSD